MFKAFENVALAKIVKDKAASEARDQLDVGEYEIDVTVHVHGTLVVSPDTEKVSTSSFLSEETLIVALRMAGCTRERAAEIIEKLARESMLAVDAKAAKTARKNMVEEYDPAGTITAILSALKTELPKTKVRGAASFKGTAVRVAASTDEAAASEKRSA